jgi:hypothetical protein
MKLYIRVKRDGFIYEFSDILAKNPSCEVVTEEEAYPERFITPEVEEVITAKRSKKKPALDLTTVDIPEPPEVTSPELAADAAKGLPQ